jgi:hypothetical protein
LKLAMAAARPLLCSPPPSRSAVGRRRPVGWGRRRRRWERDGCKSRGGARRGERRDGWDADSPGIPRYARTGGCRCILLRMKTLLESILEAWLQFLATGRWSNGGAVAIGIDMLGTKDATKS